MMCRPHRRGLSEIQTLFFFFFFFSRYRSTWHRVFWMVLLLTLLSLFGTVLTFAIWNHTRRHTSDVQAKREHQPLCLAPSCIKAAGVLIRTLNRSVDPCHDFYTFACGGWLRDNPRPPKEDRWSQFEVLKMNNLNSLHKLIENSELWTDGEAIHKARLFYSACMHRKNLFKGGLEKLQHIIDQLGGWTLPNQKPPITTQNMIQTLTKNFSVGALFAINVEMLPLKVQHNVLQISPPQLGLPSASYYLTPEFDNEVLLAYHDFMVKIALHLGLNATVAKVLMKNVLKIERNLANIMTVRGKREIRYSRTYSSINTLQESISFAFSWRKYLNHVLEQSLGIHEMVALSDKTYIEKLFAVVNSTKKSDLHNYFLWSLVLKLLPHLDLMLERRKVKLEQALYGKGMENDKPQWQFCTETTNQAFGLSLGVLFAKGRFSSALRREVEDMIRLIKQGFGSNLDSLTWLDIQTRDGAKEKMEQMREHMGCPEETMKPKFLDKFYAEFRVSKEHFSNMLEYYKFESHRLSTSLTMRDSGNHRWTMLPQTGNTYYSSSDNSMVFPAGVLQSPLYHSDYPMSINFGALGSIIGHELTHAFDNQGRRFDAKGDLKNWWTKRALAEFKNRTACLANWFQEFSAAGNRENGQQTVGENIADGGGLRAAYTAYNIWEKEHGPEGNLPAVNLTSQQLFFTAFAQTWCSSESESFLQEQLREGSHSSARFRVLGTLSNSPEFSQHFHCPLDSPMNPSRKCTLW